MLSKLLTGGLAAGAIAVPLAGVAWADPPANPGPPSVPGYTSPAPGAPAQGPAAPGQQAPAANGQGPTCIVGANAPENGPGVTGAQWQQVATLQGPVASQLGLPAGEVAKVFCTPAGTPNPQGQPAGVENPNPLSQPAGVDNPTTPGQPSGTENPGQNPPAQPTGANPSQVPPAQ